MFVLNVIGKDKGPRIAKMVLKKENNIGALTLPDFKNNMWLFGSKSTYIINLAFKQFPKQERRGSSEIST